MRLSTLAAMVLLLAACAKNSDPLADYEPLTPTTVLDAPAPRAGAGDPEQVRHGQYLVTLLGCGSCHTDGALIGTPNFERLLAGSRVGIAYSNPLVEENPGIVYPANLTPDAETGIGDWSEQEVVRMIRSGVDRHGRRQLSVMPWPAYAELSEADARAIAAYLHSLPPVRHRVPENVPPGSPATEPYVHFGVYRSRR